VTDPELVALAREGDTAAFGELVDRHRSAVYRAALAALGSHADAEEAAQDAFVIAYRRLATFRGDASFKTWLLTIAWHQAINYRRRLRTWWRVFGRQPDATEGEFADMQASGGPSPEQALSHDRLRADIVDAIRMLPRKLRDPLLLAQSGEYKYDDIASMLKVPLGTVKWRVSEARQAIKKRLRERGYSDVG
jgi:RNA polymerase sigma-70 factor (ECF subfamily)